MIKRIALAALLLAAPSAHAGLYGDAFGKCMVSASSEEDKQQLMEWIFSAISLNPAIAPYASMTPAQRDTIDRNMAGIFERLVGEACRKEASEALAYEGASAFGIAFQLLGQVAGQQIFASPEVSAGSESFQQHIDLEALREKLELTSDNS